MIMKPDAIIYHDQEYKIIKSVRYWYNLNQGER
jgi:hypothetical protein